jgi:hypothetical protein
LFGHYVRGDRNLGVALIRDGNGAGAFDTLLRYRGTTLAELWRALRLFKALQAEQAARPEPAAIPTPRALREPQEIPIEPEGRGNPRETAPTPTTRQVVATVVASALPEGPPVHGQTPIEPEARENPGEIAPASAADGGRCRAHEHLGAHEATQKCVTHASLVPHSCAAHAPPSAVSA